MSSERRTDAEWDSGGEPKTSCSSCVWNRQLEAVVDHVVLCK